MNKVLIYSLFVCIGIFLTRSATFAQIIEIQTPTTIQPGIAILTNILLLPPTNTFINAFETEIHFSDNVSILEVRNDDSQITFWIEQNLDTEKNILTLQGSIPTGISEKIHLTNLIIRTTDKTGSISIRDTNSFAYKHDGQGTPVRLQANTTTINIDASNKNSENIELPSRDIYPPQDFTPTFGNDVTTLKKTAMFFHTTDKESGIDHYIISEGNKKTTVTTSPYILQNQIFPQTIGITAVDRYGNSTTVFAEPPKNKIYILLILSAILIIFTTLFLLYTHTKRK